MIINLLRGKFNNIVKNGFIWFTVVLAVSLTFGFIIRAFSLHGTSGLFHVESLYRTAFISLGVVGLVVVCLALSYYFLAKRSQHNRWVTVPLIITTTLGIIIPGLAFLYTSGIPYVNVESSRPQLLLGYGTGAHNLPNIMVVAYTSQPTQGSLIWGINGSHATLTEDTSKLKHTFFLNNMLPATDYWYQFNNGEIYHFETPSINETNLHFAVFSDTHTGAGNNRKDLTAEMIQQIADPANEFDYFFSAGDLVEYGFQNKHWHDALEIISPLASVVPGGFVAGNHETLFTGLSKFYDYLRPDAPEPQNWYRIDTGKVHFLVLDLEWSAESFPEEQTTWLETQLVSIPSGDWKIVISHCFFYASGFRIHGFNWYDNWETIDLYTPIFEKYGIDMVFSGHDHHLEFLQHTGVSYVITGAFGGKPDPERSYTSPVSVWYAQGEYGYADITLTDNIANLVFRGPDNEVIKQFTLQK